MGRRSNLLTLASADGDSLDENMNLDGYDDEELDDEVDGEMVSESRRSKGAGRGQGWRRIELIHEDRLLRLEMADFDDYDFEYAASATDSAYSH